MKFLEIAGNFKRNQDWDVIRDIKVRGGIVHDMTILPIPNIDDNTYDGTFSEHFIEHLTKEHGIAFLKEMYRVLKPGGVIRVIWPSMDFVDYLSSDQNLDDHPFVSEYHRNILMSERPLSNPYYSSILSQVQIQQMSKQRQVALRLLHQEGEHKCVWYKNDLLNQLNELGFKNVSEMPYGKSRLDAFNGIDKKQSMRPYESTVLEAEK
jgi:predicted SAM-dependent methyltransferase